MRSPYTARDGRAAGMTKAEVSGTVTAFRQSKFKQDSYQTIVDLAHPEDAGKLLGARVVWAREDGLKILGRVVARHGSKGDRRRARHGSHNYGIHGTYTLLWPR